MLERLIGQFQDGSLLVAIDEAHVALSVSHRCNVSVVDGLAGDSIKLMITAWSFLVQSVGMSYLPTASLHDLCHSLDCHTVTKRPTTWHCCTGWSLFQLVRPYGFRCGSGEITKILVYKCIVRQIFEGRAGHVINRQILVSSIAETYELFRYLQDIRKRMPAQQFKHDVFRLMLSNSLERQERGSAAKV